MRSVESVRSLLEDLPAELIENGAFFSRPYGPIAGQVFGRDPWTVESLRRVKAIVDPANIMNPGKLCYGAGA